MVRGACSLQFSEDFFFVIEQVAHEAVGMTFVHGNGCLGTRAENARGEYLSEGSDKGFIGGSEFNEASEVGSNCIECSDVSKTELAEGVLKNRYSRLSGSGGIWGRIYGFDDFIDLSRNKGIYSAVNELSQAL